MADTARDVQKKDAGRLAVVRWVRVKPTARAVFPQRPPVAVTCPNCWKEQRSVRNSCWCCGTQFFYESEGN